MELKGKKIGFVLTGSFCTFQKVLPKMREIIKKGADILPIMSYNSYNFDTKFGTASDFEKEIEEITNKKIIHTIVDAEPIGPKKMTDIMNDNNHPMEDLKKIHDGVWQAAYEIIEKKRATYYGIGMALNRIIKAVLNDENSILTVSTYQNGEYKQEGMYIGVPAIINKNGVKEILELKLNDEDQAKFNHSCDIMKENIKNEIDPILNA